PELEPVSLRVGRPAEPAEVAVVLDSVLHRRAGRAELGQQGVEVPDAIIHHERRRARTEILGVRRKRRPRRLFPCRGRRERPARFPRFDGHARVLGVPGGERLGIARLEKYAADPKDPFHTISFSSRSRSTEFKTARPLLVLLLLLLLPL